MQTNHLHPSQQPVMLLLLGIVASLFQALVCDTARGDDWVTWRSTYTHDPYGQPVDQYAQPVQPLAPDRGDFVRSGYRHFRSTLQVGQSADNVHIVEQWGAPVQPYEAWRFPFRPYGVPYEAWGPPPVGIGVFPPVVPGWGQGGGWGQGAWGNGAWGQGGGQIPGGQPPGFQRPSVPGHQGPPWNPGPVYPGPGYPGYPNFPGYQGPFPLQPQYQGQPWFDGTYPSAPPLDPRSDAEFFYRPPPL